MHSTPPNTGKIPPDDTIRKDCYNLYDKNKTSPLKTKNNVYRRKCFVRESSLCDPDRLSNSFVFGDSSSGLYGGGAARDGSVKFDGRGQGGDRVDEDCGRIGGGGYLEKNKKAGTERTEKLEARKPEKTYKSRLLGFAGSEISNLFGG